MSWRAVLWSVGIVVMAALVWEWSGYVLDWAGLSAFDPLDRICLVFLVLSVTEGAMSRFRPQ